MNFREDKNGLSLDEIITALQKIRESLPGSMTIYMSYDSSAGYDIIRSIYLEKMDEDPDEYVLILSCIPECNSDGFNKFHLESLSEKAEIIYAFKNPTPIKIKESSETIETACNEIEVELSCNPYYPDSDSIDKTAKELLKKLYEKE